MPIIILEGIDGSGKSTLATRIVEYWPGTSTVIHRGPIQSSVEEELIMPLLNLEPDELLIADRWHLSELIYGPLYRGTSQINTETMQQIEKTLHDLGAVRVVLQPPLEEVTQRLTERGEDFLVESDAPYVYAAYAALAQTWGYMALPDNGEATARLLVDLASAAVHTKSTP